MVAGEDIAGYHLQLDQYIEASPSPPRHFTSFRWVAFLALAAQRLAMTEQSVVMSWTRSMGCSFAMVGMLSLPSFDSTISAPGRYHPSKISRWAAESENSLGSVNEDRSNSDDSGVYQGGNICPLTLELSIRIIFSRVLKPLSHKASLPGRMLASFRGLGSIALFDAFLIETPFFIIRG